jgi:hypothetical protein
LGLQRPCARPVRGGAFYYKEHIRCIVDSWTGDEIELGFHDDMLVHDGKYYGDFEIAASFGSGTDAQASG